MRSLIRPALVLFAIFTIVTGILYPLAVTGIAQGIFPFQANGSILPSGGSQLIGQSFDAPEYFWGRLSAVNYDAATSGGSNNSVANPALAAAAQARIDALRAADPDNVVAIPVDLVTTSASGLDPHISVAAARYQVHRVAVARALTEEQVLALVEQHTEGRQFGILGEPRVNVLSLNQALDGL